MITKTLGSSGADFTSVNAWVSWVQANAVSSGNLTDSVTLDVLAVGVSATSNDTVSGWAPGGSGFTTTISSTAGNSANTNASVQTNAFYYNTANGAFISYGGLSGVTLLDIAVDQATISNVQLACTSGAYNNVISSNQDHFTVSHVIIDGGSGPNGGLAWSGGVKLVVNDSLIRAGLDAIGNSGGGGNLYSYNNTLVHNSGTPGGTGIGPDNYQSWHITNTAFINWTTEINNLGSFVVAKNCGTTNSSWQSLVPLSSQVSVALTDFVGGASLNDFRLASGAAKLRNNGSSGTNVPTTDWAFTTIPQGTEYDIGAWAFLSPSFTGAFTDSIAISDSIGEAMRVVGAFSDSAATSETLAAQMHAAGAFSESVSSSDVFIATLAVVGASLSDTIATSDLFAASYQVLGSLSDTISTADTMAAAMTLAASLSDHITTSDLTVGQAEMIASLADALASADLFDTAHALAFARRWVQMNVSNREVKMNTSVRNLTLPPD